MKSNLFIQEVPKSFRFRYLHHPDLYWESGRITENGMSVHLTNEGRIFSSKGGATNAINRSYTDTYYGMTKEFAQEWIAANFILEEVTMIHAPSQSV